MVNKKIYSVFGIMFLLVVLVLSSLSSIPVMANPGASTLHKTTSPVYWFSDGSLVRGGRSTLVRHDDRISMHLYTNGLPRGNAVTIWWVIFNQPENCSHPEGMFRCGPGDLENAEAEPSVLYATGHAIGTRGRSGFGSTLRMGETPGVLIGSGLTNPHGADVHFVVRSHGPLIPGLVKEMISTFGGGCNNVPEGTGTPGPNTCVDLQFSVHESV